MLMHQLQGADDVELFDAGIFLRQTSTGERGGGMADVLLIAALKRGVEGVWGVWGVVYG